ncbi:MAG: hypothetical protein KF773_11075 [Deltaproteobacteria bacterium]|nr:hypothetical protein [Deltaproteobacteria bacterium]
MALAALILGLAANVYLWRSTATPIATHTPRTARGVDRAELAQRRLLRTETRTDDRRRREDEAPGDPGDPGSSKTEATAKLYLDRIFQTEPYAVACVGRTCTLDPPDAPDWQHDLQTAFPERAWFCRMSFAPTEVLLELCPPEEMGAAVTRGILTAFELAPATAACLTAHPDTHGDLALDVLLDPHLRATLTGSLASAPVGLCLQRVLDDIVARAELPPGVTALPRAPLELHLPMRKGPI